MHIFLSIITLFVLSLFLPASCKKPKDAINFGKAPYTGKESFYNAGEDNGYIKNTYQYLSNTCKIFFKTMCSKNFWHFIEEKEKKQWYDPSKPANKTEKPTITWIGHATALIQIGNTNILTDPNFKDYMLIPNLYNRATPLGVTFKDLPPIDYVIVSHNHPDHLDAKAIQKLAKQGTHFLIPQGNKKKFIKWGINKKSIHEFFWNKTFKCKENSVSFTFLPAKHATGRSLFDQNRSLWGSWIINHNGFTIYFAGDTAYGDHFKAIGKEHTINAALLPIGPNEPRNLMEKVYHMSAQQAGQAWLDLKAKKLIPIHWGTFPLGTDRFLDPVVLLDKWAKKNAPKQKDNITFLRFGEQKELN